jgi:hypothetical protein
MATVGCGISHKDTKRTDKCSNNIIKTKNKQNYENVTASRMALKPTQPPIQWVPGALSVGVKRPGREADHSPPSGAEVKEYVELYPTPPIRLHGVVLS